jgi:hypothetical protein
MQLLIAVCIPLIILCTRANDKKNGYTGIMNISHILSEVEKTIKTPEEREYFLIHEVRYKRILEEICVIASARQSINGINTDTLTQRHTDARLRVLDVGCFPYHLGAAIEMMGFDVYGISSSHEPMNS